MNGIFYSTNELSSWDYALSSGLKGVSDHSHFLIENSTLITTILGVALAILLTLVVSKFIYNSFCKKVIIVYNPAPSQNQIKPQDLPDKSHQEGQENAISFLSSKALEKYSQEEKNICLELRILDDSINSFEYLDFSGRWRVQAKDFDSLKDEINNYECHGGRSVTTSSCSPLEVISEENQKDEQALTFCQFAKKMLSDLQVKYKQLSKENMSFSLPHDIQRIIFRYCSTKTIRILSSVSKRINRLANADLGKIIVRQLDPGMSLPLPLKGPIIIRANLRDDDFTIEDLRKILQLHNQRSPGYINDARVIHHRGKGPCDEGVSLKTIYEEQCKDKEQCLKKPNLQKIIFLDLIYRKYPYLDDPDLYLPNTEPKFPNEAS